ncbi:NAD-dependent epimerase/dehydratase family protein [Halocatena halophila]|uniref:NAD-dependent epimerase/dehydratase family protein n=1 Tax=Halocatena halophila TaxID=2814576 RepID=UPI002ED010C1
MSIQTVAVTGGNGKIGSAIIDACNDAGYRTVNLNRGKQKTRVTDGVIDRADRYVQSDVLDPGSVYAALAETNADAVVHMASIPNPLSNVSHETYESNVMGSYNVLSAAIELALESVVLPSSVNVMGGTFQNEPMEVATLPVDETHPVTPRDPYGTAKHAIEVTADAFGRRADSETSIASLRLPWVAGRDELLETFDGVDRSLDAVTDDDALFGRDDLFAYIERTDAARLALAAIGAPFDDHERFWGVADTTSVAVETPALVEACYPNTTVERSFSGHSALVSTAKAAQLLGWEPTHRLSFKDPSSPVVVSD